MANIVDFDLKEDVRYYIYIYSSFFYVGAKIVVFAMKHMLS